MRVYLSFFKQNLESIQSIWSIYNGNATGNTKPKDSKSKLRVHLTLLLVQVTLLCLVVNIAVLPQVVYVQFRLKYTNICLEKVLKKR